MNPKCSPITLEEVPERLPEVKTMEAHTACCLPVDSEGRPEVELALPEGLEATPQLSYVELLEVYRTACPGALHLFTQHRQLMIQLQPGEDAVRVLLEIGGAPPTAKGWK